MDRSLSVHEILQARILGWVDISFSRGSSWPGHQIKSRTLQADSWLFEPPGKRKSSLGVGKSRSCADKAKQRWLVVPDAFPCVDAESVLVAQLRPTLCGPTVYSLPGSSVHGILQARRLEWVAIPFSRVSSQPGTDLGLLHCRQILYHLSHQGSPKDNLWFGESVSPSVVSNSFANPCKNSLDWIFPCIFFRN